MANLKVRLNQEDNMCIGCAACVSLIGEVFELDDNGLSRIVLGTPGVIDISDDRLSATITDPELIQRVKEFVEDGLCAGGVIGIVEED